MLGALVWQPWDTGGGAGESAWAWTILADVEGTAPEETRQLVAGIAQQYKPEELTGKTIVIVANLQPAKIRGVESQGMLLAAIDGEDLALIVPDKPFGDGKTVG